MHKVITVAMAMWGAVSASGQKPQPHVPLEAAPIEGSPVIKEPPDPPLSPEFWRQVTAEVIASRNPGMIVDLRSEAQTVSVPASRAASSRLIRSIQIGDEYGAADLIEAGELVVVPVGTKVRILEWDMSGADRLFEVFADGFQNDTRRNAACRQAKSIAKLQNRAQSEDVETFCGGVSAAERFSRDVLAGKKLADVLKQEIYVKVRILEGAHTGKLGFVPAAAVGDGAAHLAPKQQHPTRRLVL